MATDFPAYVAKNYESDTQVFEYTPSQTAGETMAKAGELVYYDTADAKVKRCGADPALILGIAEVVSEDARVLTPNGKIPIRVLMPGAVLGLCSATTPVEVTHRGNDYGIVRLASGNWAIDISETTNKRVHVIDVDVTRGIFFCKPMAANLQSDAVAS
jgi:hypothetical protein